MAMRPFSLTVLVACVVAATLGGAACDRREERSTIGTGGESSTDTRRDVPVTVTGCVREAPGFKAFVLSAVGSDQDGTPEQKWTYRLEGGKNLDQYIGTQVRVMGRLAMEDATTGTTGTSGSSGRELRTGDLPELYIDSMLMVANTCASSAESSRLSIRREKRSSS